MKPLTYTVALVGLISLVGCQAPQRVPQTMHISTTVPTVAAIAETKEAQEKGRIEIAVVPAAYKAVQKTKVTLQQVPPPALAIMLTSSEQQRQKVFVEERHIPYLETKPGKLQFSVRVNNKLSRVFRGQGSVVQFNVCGKLVPFGQVDYAEFLNGIVPPRNEATFTINGPAIDSIPEKGTIGIFLYDVVTATDTAGNVTEKQNFEWYFNYTTAKTEEEAAFKVTQGFMDAEAFRERKMEERIEARKAQQ